MNCLICDRKDPVWSWTDTHGVAQCAMCGTPYRIYHYDAENKPIEKPPEVQIKTEYIAAIRQYWQDHKQRMPSGFSFPGGQELATRQQSEDFYQWLRDQKPNAAVNCAGSKS